MRCFNISNNFYNNDSRKIKTCWVATKTVLVKIFVNILLALPALSLVFLFFVSNAVTKLNIKIRTVMGSALPSFILGVCFFSGF